MTYTKLHHSMNHVAEIMLDIFSEEQLNNLRNARML